MIKSVLLAFSMLFATTALSQTEVKKKTIVLSEDNVIYFGSEFNFQTVADLQKKIAIKDERLPSHQPLYIIIDSGGGSISAGLELISNVSALKRDVHTITVFGASMAFQTVQGLGKRYVIDNGTLMSHKARGSFYGEFGDGNSQLDSRYNFWLRKIKRLDKVAVGRSNGKTTLEQYRSLYENEYWCDGQDCVDQGFADEVANVVCDESLNGTGKQKLRVMWMGRPLQIDVVKSRCPLVTGIISLAVQVDGKFLLDPSTRQYGRYEIDVSKEAVRNQAIWEYVKSLVYKKDMPSRVIYMEIPSNAPATSFGPQMVK